MWRLKAYVVDVKIGQTVVTEWYHHQPGPVQDKLEFRLKFLKAQPPAVWQRPYVGTLTDNCDGLFELRFEVFNVQHRAIGYYSGEKEFTILAFCTERDGDFDPSNICDTANERRALIRQDGRYAREFTFED
jgi:hypothetical protein